MWRIEMEFSSSKEQIELRDADIRFARQEIVHDVAMYNQKGHFPFDLWRKHAEKADHRSTVSGGS
jgi:hypothetical protein